MRRYIILILCVLLLPSLARATVLFSEDFENHLYPNWFNGDACPSPLSPSNLDNATCNARISTALAHGGTHSLLKDYSVASCPTGLGCGTTLIRPWAPAVTELWWRVWMYPENFTYYSDGETKHIIFRCQSGCVLGSAPNDFIFDSWWGSSALSYTDEGGNDGLAPCKPIGQDVSCNFYANRTPNSLTNNQWGCVVGHIKQNAVGQFDGVLEIYINGTPALTYTGRQLHQSNQVPNFSYVDVFTQNGRGKMYVDDLIVGMSRSDVDNCPGAVGDTTPPSVPTNLTVTP